MTRVLNDRLEIKVPAETKVQILDAAKRENVTVSEWILHQIKPALPNEDEPVAIIRTSLPPPNGGAPDKDGFYTLTCYRPGNSLGRA